MDNGLPIDDDYNEDEILRNLIEGEDVTGYECMSCGHIQDDNGMGGECDVCGAKCLDEIHE